MREMLQELVDSRGVAMRVDRGQGVIRGVKILGLQSRNGRTYLPEALAEAVPLYEGAKVNVNHPKGNPASPRDYRDRIGVIRGVTVRPGDGLFADFHFNPKHALAEQVAWDAEHAPENVGFSHNVEARTVRRGDRLVIEAITRVQSVDLVADPATTRGLFESQDDDRKQDLPDLAGLTVALLEERRPDLVRQMLEEPTARIAELEAEIDRREAARAVAERQRLVRELLAEHHLPDPEAADDSARSIVSERFLRTLMEAPDREAVERLVRQRARLVERAGELRHVPWPGDRRPVSRDRSQLGRGPGDFKTFVEAIT